VRLRSGVDDVKRRIFLTLLGLELRPLGLPERSQSLYVPFVVYLATLSNSRSMASDDGVIMTFKGCGWKRSYPNVRYCPVILLDRD
jgi:hypothetical protein